MLMHYSNRGAAYTDKGELECTIVDCSKAIELKPDYASAYLNRGRAYLFCVQLLFLLTRP